LRKERHHSLTVACKLLALRCNLRVSRTALNQWENGHALPGIPDLIGLCELYGVDPGYFFEAAPEQTVGFDGNGGGER